MSSPLDPALFPGPAGASDAALEALSPIPAARMKWLLRRGMRELDLMVMRYHDTRYAEAPAGERLAFRRLLTEVEDPDLWAWAMGYDEPPVEFSGLMDVLRGQA